MWDTTFRFIASSATSRGVQCVTGRSDASSGCSQAMAMISRICSGVKVPGPPGRGASTSVSAIQRLKSDLRGPSSVAAKRSWAAAHRRRHRHTVSASTPNSIARSRLRPPLPAANTIRARWTRRCSDVGLRTKCSNISCCRALSSMDGAIRMDSTYSLQDAGRPSWERDASTRGTPLIQITINRANRASMY